MCCLSEAYATGDNFAIAQISQCLITGTLVPGHEEVAAGMQAVQ